MGGGLTYAAVCQAEAKVFCEDFQPQSSSCRVEMPLSTSVMVIGICKLVYININTSVI